MALRVLEGPGLQAQARTDEFQRLVTLGPNQPLGTWLSGKRAGSRLTLFHRNATNRHTHFILDLLFHGLISAEVRQGESCMHGRGITLR